MLPTLCVNHMGLYLSNFENCTMWMVICIIWTSSSGKWRNKKRTQHVFFWYIFLLKRAVVELSPTWLLFSLSGPEMLYRLTHILKTCDDVLLFIYIHIYMWTCFPPPPFYVRGSQVMHCYKILYLFILVSRMLLNAVMAKCEPWFIYFFPIILLEG